MKKVIYALMLALLGLCSPEEIKPKDNNTSENPGGNPSDFKQTHPVNNRASRLVP